MRIVIVTPTFGEAFGQERVLRDSVRLLINNHHEVFVITDRVIGTIENSTPVFEVDGYSKLNSFGPRKPLKRILKLVQTLKPDVIHFYDLVDPRITRVLKKRWPLIFSAHTVAATCPASHRLRISDQSVCQSPGGWRCLKQSRTSSCLDNYGSFLRQSNAVREFMRKRGSLLQHFDVVLANSSYMERTLLLNGVDSKKLKTVSNPVAIPSFSTQIEPFGTPVILCVARLVEQKGVRLLVSALSSLKEIPWRCYIYGEGPEEIRLKAYIAELGLDTRIFIKKKIAYDEMAQLLARQPRLVVQPSLGPESFGLAVAEATGLGIPIVAFDVPALNELVEDGQNGLLVPAANAKAFSQSIARLLLDDKLRSDLSTIGPEMIRARYSPGEHLKGILEAYHQALSAHSPQTRAHRPSDLLSQVALRPEF